MYYQRYCLGQASLQASFPSWLRHMATRKASDQIAAAMVVLSGLFPDDFLWVSFFFLFLEEELLDADELVGEIKFKSLE